MIMGRPGVEHILSGTFLGLVEYSKCDCFGYSKCSRVYIRIFLNNILSASPSL